MDVRSKIWREWPIVSLVALGIWLLVAIALDDNTSGMIFGAAAGSSTFRDPIFIVFEAAAALLVRRWWQMLLAAVAIGLGYALFVSILNENPLRLFGVMGRILSVVVICSIVGMVRVIAAHVRDSH